ncbi:MAG: hypothetical protein JWQ90_4889 [Hydrocarboniphaga sp.]|nr:hypothetical protein [Hydrocarboniphaga sp.]
MVLIGWTALVLLLVPYRRFKAGFGGRVTLDDFRFGESATVPGDVSIPNRNFMNLLEVPVLFYVVCLTLFVTQHGSSSALMLEWSYVGFRVLHSLIHLTYNRVTHRLAVFVASDIVLLVLWAQVLWKLSR